MNWRGKKVLVTGAGGFIGSHLVEYFGKPDNRLKAYDWWYFSKLVENVDEIKIPYFNKEKGKFADFNPDFIFWLKKGDKYFIKFDNCCEISMQLLLNFSNNSFSLSFTSCISFSIMFLCL